MHAHVSGLMTHLFLYLVLKCLPSYVTKSCNNSSNMDLFFFFQSKDLQVKVQVSIFV